MLKVFRIMMFIYALWSGYNSMAYEEAPNSPNMIFLVSGVLFILTFLIPIS